MAKLNKAVPKDWTQLMDAERVAKTIARISYEILERNKDLHSLAVVGIKTAGEYLARRIQSKIKEIEGVEPAFGVLDITLYRDDLSMSADQPELKGTQIDFPISGATIILVDDILYTGRTIRAAMDAIIDFGRPKSVQLAVLADRGHRELPIRADYVGKNVPTNREQFVRVRLSEMGYEDGVYLMDRKKD